MEEKSFKKHGVSLNVVGFPYCSDLAGCVDEFLAGALGHSLTICPQPSNPADKTAIRAFDWQGRHVGYVAHYCKPAAWALLRGSGRSRLKGKVVKADIEHHCLTIECTVKTVGEPVADIYAADEFTSWQYGGPVMPLSDELDRLEYMMGEIDERLDCCDAWSEEDLTDFIALSGRFSSLSQCDISGEMSDYRRRLTLRLEDARHGQLRALAEEMRRSFGRSGREAAGGSVLSYWTEVLMHSEGVAQMMVHRDEYDVDKVVRELAMFPESMYSEWCENRSHFVSKMLYLHIPREVLWRFLSGIVFVETMKGRRSTERHAAEQRAAERARELTGERNASQEKRNIILTGEHAVYYEKTKENE